VLLLAAEGLTDKEIARHLNLSRRTIGTYWERLRLKLGPYSRTQLVARFLRVEAEGDGAAYRNLFATWEEGVWILSPSGATLYANHRIATLFGFTPEEFPDADARTLFQAATSTSIEAVLEAAQSEPHVVEFRLQRGDGNAVWLRMRGSAVTDARGRVSAIVLLLHDVTMEKRVTHTLESCETTLDFVARHSSDLIMRFDQNLVCVSVNPALVERLRQEEDALVGRAIQDLGDLFQPNDQWVQFLRRALATGEPQTFTGAIADVVEAGETHLLPEPSPEFLPTTILAITKRDCGC
jgi:PAS domain S-box-containing protein